MAYRESFGGDVDYAYSSGKRGLGSFDITSRLDKASSALSRYAANNRKVQQSIRDMGIEQEKLKDKFRNGGVYSVEDEKRIDDYSRKIKEATKSTSGFRQGLGMLSDGFSEVAKGLLKLNVSAITGVFDFLISSIKRVYELQERWTRAIGGFNMKMGGLTAGLKGATKAATQWSGTIRGLTNGDIQEGIEMFGEFTMAIGRVVKKGDEFSRFGIQLARGFNLGGAGGGQVAKVFENMGLSAGKSAVAISEMADAANLAGIPVNMLAKDIEESSEYMARFGKASVKSFVTGAAYARKFDISMKQLQSSVEKFDMFDEAARSMAKLNTAFGLSTNAMDLMLEDDPAARLEMIRQQFLSQGMTYDKMSAKQVRFAAEQMGVTNDQLAALLSLENANVSYADFQAKQAAREKSEIAAKKDMEKALRKTAQTMYAFGIAFDRVTVAIANAIKPLLVVLGLAKDGNEKFTSFGKVMESITVTVEEFFNSLAKNAKWNAFMKELAKDLQRLGRNLREFVVSGGAAELVGDLAVGMKKFYMFVRDSAIVIAKMLKPLIPVFVKIAEHSKEIVMAWLAMKGGSVASGWGDSLKDMSESAGGSGKFGKGLKRAGAGLAIGGGIGAVSEMVGIGGGTGAAIGGTLGGLAGPLGAVVGSAVGILGEKLVGWLSSSKGKSKLEKSRDELAKTLKKESDLRDSHNSLLDASKAKIEAEAAQRKGLRKELIDEISKKGNKNKLDKEQLSALQENILGMSRMTGATGIGRVAINKLAKGQTDFNDKELKALLTSYDAYNKRMNDLNTATSEAVKLKLQELEFSKIGVGTKVMEAQAKMKRSEKEFAEKDLKAIIDDKLVTPVGDELVAALKAGDLSKAREMTGLDDKKLKLKQLQLTTKGEAVVKRDMDIAAARHKVNKLEIEANSLDQEASKMRMKFDDQIFRTEMRQMAMRSEEFKKFSMMPGISNLSPEKAFDVFLSNQKDYIKSEFGGESGYQAMTSRPMASGGIVRRPMHALIGEAGPEAVIPLRAMARGRMRQPTKFGGAPAHSMVSGGGSGGTNTVIVPVSIQIDNREIARAVAKGALTSR